MKVSIVGMSGVKRGEYKGYTFENRYLYCLTDEPAEEGYIADIIKVKESFVQSHALKVGKDYIVSYDRFGNVCDMRAQ